MLKDKAAVGLGFWVVLLAALTWWDCSSASGPYREGHQQAEETSSEHRESVSAEERIANYTYWLAWFTCALVVVSSVQIYFLTRADKTARISADAAKHAADASIAAETALLHISSPSVFCSERNGCVIQFQIENVGKTVGFLNAHSSRICAVLTIPEVPKYGQEIPRRGTAVYHREALDGFSVSLDEGDIEQGRLILSMDENVPGLRFFFFGYFRYDDVFGRHRKSGYGYSVEVFRSGVGLLSRAGGSTYNYTHNEN